MPEIVALNRNLDVSISFQARTEDTRTLNWILEQRFRKNPVGFRQIGGRSARIQRQLRNKQR